MRRANGVLLAAALLALAGCKCGKSAVPDAGAPKAADAAGKAQAVDLKQAMFTAFPDERSVRILEASASLQRAIKYRVPHGQALNELMKPSIAEKGFRPPAPGDPPMVLAMKPPFALMGAPMPGGLTLELVLPLAPEDFAKLAQTPTPMTTEQLQAMVPSPKEGKVLSDTFFFSVQYQGEPAKAEARVRGLVARLADSGWTLKTAPPGYEVKGMPDGGALLGSGSAGPVLFELERAYDGGKVRASIGEGTVAVAYVQPLVTHDPAP